MMERLLDRRGLVAMGALALLAGCTVVPKRQPSAPPPPKPGPSGLPQDTARHRIALLVPMSGPNAGAGQSIANAATMALLDTNAQNLRITTYDTATDPAGAASRAITDGNGLILGPLTADETAPVAAAVRGARVPVISFSNDPSAAGKDVFVMGTVPDQSIGRTVSFAASRGVRSFAALVPQGDYGERASAALVSAARAAGSTVVSIEPYDRSNTSIGSAARRLSTKGGFDAVMILDGGRFARLAAPAFRASANAPRILGTELWSGDGAVLTSPALRGAWFAALPDERFRQFSASYKLRFGAQPYRMATVGYDAVLLTLRIARDWPNGAPFPAQRLTDPKGFLGLDGPFRFGRRGVVERAFEIREVRAGGMSVVSPAPERFDD